jgi:deoxyribose-phosphate aldolase
VITVNELAGMIDHAIIDAWATERDMHAGTDVAAKYRTACFVTQPFRIRAAVKRLEGAGIPVQCPVGYPYGSDHRASKELTAHQALDDGAGELDIVMNISAFLSGDFAYVEDELRAIVEIAKPYGVICKAIIECYYLSREQRLKVAKMAELAGCGFVKTSTGLRPDHQASIAEDCRAMRAVLKPETIVKASGGCFNLDALLLYHRAGARRFGASETANILDDLRGRIERGEYLGG